MNFKKRSLFSIFIFLISPIMSLPVILYNIYCKNKFSINLLVLLLGVISLLYIAPETSDKTRYIGFVLENSKENFWEYLNNIEKKGSGDYIAYIYFYLINKLGIPLQLGFFIATVFTAGVWFSFYKNYLSYEKLIAKEFFVFTMLFFFSFSLLDLISGVRFYMASSFLLLTYHFLFGTRTKKLLPAMLCSLLAVLTHFSSIFFLFLFFLFNKNKRFYKKIFILSMLFAFIPPTFLYNIIDLFSYNISTKIEIYLTREDVAVTGFITASFLGKTSYIVQYISVAFVYYILLTQKENSFFDSLMYFLCSFNNIFIQFPTVFMRYNIIILHFGCIYLLMKYISKSIRLSSVYIMLGIFVLRTIFILGGYRTFFSESFSGWESFFFPFILFKDIPYYY